MVLIQKIARSLARINLFILILLLQVTHPPVVHGQEIRFRHFTIDDGLSQGLIYAIIQDRRGFMWFGTQDGLNRFDGYEFRVFKHDPFDSTSISSNAVTALHEDTDGRIWIGTADGMLSFFRPTTGRFSGDLIATGSPSSSGPYEIGAIAEFNSEAGQQIWVATRGGGLICIKIPQGLESSGAAMAQVADESVHNGAQLTRFLHDPANPNSLSGNSVMSIHIDRQGVLWASTRRGLAALDLKSTDVDEGHFRRFQNVPGTTSSLQDGFIIAIYESENGTIWLGSHEGLVRFDRKTEEFTLLPNPPGLFEARWMARMTSICEDREGRVWFGTANALGIFEPATQKSQYLQRDPKDPQSLGHNSILPLYRDRANRIWVGTVGKGLSVYDPNTKRFQSYTYAAHQPPYLIDFSIRSILMDKSGALWVGLRDDLYQYDRASRQALRFNPDGPRMGTVGSIINDRQGNLWLGTDGGLIKYDPNSWRQSKYRPDPHDRSALRDSTVGCVYEDNSGFIWAAYTGGLSRWDAQTDRLIYIPFAVADSTNMENASVASMRQSSDGSLWLGSFVGLLRFTPATATFKLYRNDPRNRSSLSYDEVKSILPDPKEPERFLWLGTGGGGLNRFEIATETFSHYTEADGLPNNVVYGVIADDQGNLWMSTNKGLSKFDPQTETFESFDVKDGLQSNEFNTRAYSKAADGEIFFGGVEGFNAFYPAAIQRNPNVPQLVLTDFRLFNKSVSLKDPNSPLDKPISEADEIRLSYRDNVITFEFAALDYSDPQKNQYAYMMEGFNEDWIYSGTKRTATFTNLDPGEYVFKVKGSNNDGVWNEGGSSVRLVIAPPWWQTWWAYTLFGLFLFGALFGLRRYEMNRQQLKHRLELQQVASEKMHELDGLKSRFFANISHEFRTPLTLIMGQLDSELTSPEEKKDKNRLQMAIRNARQLLQLINQLLDLSKLDAGQMALHVTKKNLVSLLKNLTGSFESLATSKKISLRFESSHEEIPVYFEQDKVEKVIYNLLSNAFKFTPEGGSVLIKVEGSTHSPPSAGGIESSPLDCDAASAAGGVTDEVKITVRDSGIGIPKDRLPHVFDRFYQVDSATTRGHDGTGIGLALTRELVQIHGGGISVQSSEGFGSTFVVTLPLGKAHLKPEQIVEESRIEDRASQILTGFETLSELQESSRSQAETPIDFDRDVNEPGSSILIVEDNPDVCTYIRENLEDDYQVSEAPDGEAGFAKAQEDVPDLIITDVMMPKMDGYELTHKLRQDQVTSHIPIIMVTAKAAEEDKFEGLETGVDAYLIKPFSTKELRIRVRKLIELRRQLLARVQERPMIAASDVMVSSFDQEFLGRLQKAVEENMHDEGFQVDELSHKIGMSRRQLQRKLNALLDCSPAFYIRRIRLERAKQLLDKNAGNVTEIAFDVGYGNVSAFSRAFREAFGQSPSEVLKK